MGVLDTTYTFTATDVVTSAKLNNVIDQTTFTSSAFSGTTLAINGSGQLRVNASGITSLELADNSVNTAKILDANVTTAKIADANITQAKIATNVVGKGATFLAFKTANQNITANAFNQITSISNISYNTDGGFSGSTSTFTASIAGYYLLMGMLQTPSASTNFQASIWINDSDAILGSQISEVTLVTRVQGMRYLSVGDTITLKAIASNVMTINAAEFSGCLIRSA